MANTIRIKRRSAAGSAGAPTQLAPSELAYNEADSTLYYGFGDAGGGVSSSIVAIAGPGAFASLSGNLTFSGTVSFTNTSVTFASGFTLPVNRGGTGASSAGDARTNLGLGTMATETATDYLSKSGNLSGLASTSTARTNLGLGTMSTETASDYLAKADNLSGLASASTARTNLGLGSISTQDSSNVTITGGSITGITDLAIADGGTGASTAADARTNLGLGTMSTETATDYLSKAGNLSGLASTSTSRTNLGLGSISTQDASNVTITGGSITGITDLAIADGGTGASTAADARTNLGLGSMAVETASDYLSKAGNLSGLASTSTARTNLGLGSISTQDSSNVTISGGSISGITDLAVADGGTGASTASGALVNLLPSYTSNGSKILALNSGATDVEWITLPATGVTSVALSAPNIFSVSGSPVTSTGTLSLSLANQTANYVWAGPTSGGSATPAFRALVAGDIPALSYLSTSGGTVSGNVTVTGDLTVQGTTTQIDATVVTVADKNVVLGNVATPTDTTADGGGITLKGATDKTINWVDATDSWTSSEHIDLASSKVFKINGTTVLSATALDGVAIDGGTF